MVAKISFPPEYNVMLMSRLSSLRYKTRYAYAYVVVRTRLYSTRVRSSEVESVFSAIMIPKDCELLQPT